MNPKQVSESDLAEFLSLVAMATQEAAPQLAEAHWTLFEELTEQGFSEEQAIELMREFSVEPSI